MHAEEPRFPPLLTGYRIKAPDKVFETACAGADAGTYGAADVVWARNTSRVEMAVVLEPDVLRRVALQMVPLFELAVIEAVGALMPPKTSVLLRWPLALIVNAGVVGKFHFAAAPCGDDEVPDWLVAGVEIQLARELGDVEPGHLHEQTCLAEEGADDATRTMFLEMIGAYVLTWIQSWQDKGLAAFAEMWVGRVEGYDAPAEIDLVGGSGARVHASVLGLDEDLRLLVKVAEGDVRALEIAAMVGKSEGAAAHQSARGSP
jgi:BirA family biotin operon repressor/biotin-[acetyl-CoA-carboxylase] ligase